jgi:hypothetical protein
MNVRNSLNFEGIKFRKDWHSPVYEGVSNSFRTGRLERELQLVQLSATRWSCIAILWVSLVSFATITLCIAFQRVFIVIMSVYFVMSRSGNFWIHPCMCVYTMTCCVLVNATRNNPISWGSMDYISYLRLLFSYWLWGLLSLICSGYSRG